MHMAAATTQEHYPRERSNTMQYLVMPNRILYLPHLAIYDIYKPMAHLQDQRCSVLASEPENKRTYTLYQGFA